MLRKHRLRGGVLKNTQFITRGKPVSLAALQRYATRNQINLNALVYRLNCSDDVVRQAIECVTPPSSPLPVPKIYDGAMKFRCLIADVLQCSPDNGDTEVMWRAESRQSRRCRDALDENMDSALCAHYDGDHALAIYQMRRVCLEVENFIQYWDCHTFVDWLGHLHDPYHEKAVDLLRLLQIHAKDWSQATLPSSDLRRHLLMTLVEIDVSQLQQVMEDVELLLLDKLEENLSDGLWMDYRMRLGRSKLQSDRMLAIDDYLPTREAAVTQFGTNSSDYFTVLESRCSVIYWRECYAEAEELAQHLLDSALALQDRASLIFRSCRACRQLCNARFGQGPHRFDEARAAAIEATLLNDQYCHEYPENVPPFYRSEMMSLMEMLKDIAEHNGKHEEAVHWAQRVLELRKIPDDDGV